MKSRRVAGNATNGVPLRYIGGFKTRSIPSILLIFTFFLSSSVLDIEKTIDKMLAVCYKDLGILGVDRKAVLCYNTRFFVVRRCVGLMKRVSPFECAKISI